MTNQDVDIHLTEKNENVTVAVTKKPHCQIKFDIQVNQKATEAAYQKALRNVNKEVNIPGFRKGRAPDKMVIERYGNAIQQEFVDLALQTGFNEAIHLTHIHPLKDGKTKRPIVHECSREKGANFTIEFEARPTFPSINLSEIEITRVTPQAVTDQDRQNALQNLLHHMATYEPIEDRPVEENDFVNITVTLQGEHPREVIKQQRTQVSSTGLPSWLREKVIGLKAGETAEGISSQDLTLHEADPDFTPTPFTITVHSISKGILPHVDDELAKRVGLQTVDELHKKIEERIADDYKDEAVNKQLYEIQAKLLERYPLDLPLSYLEANKSKRLHEHLDDLELKGYDTSTLSQEEFNKIDQNLEHAAAQSLQIYFLLRKIASDNHITVTDDDMRQELTIQFGLMSRGQQNIDLNDKEQLHERLHNLAMDRKVKEHLLSHVTYSSSN